MKLTFTKQAGKFDALLIERADGSKETVACPKQGIIPHDMIHFAVEKIILRRGFLSRVAGGEAADLRMKAEADADAIERLVETVQAELWSGRAPAEEVLALYRHSCMARSHACFPVSEHDLELIRLEVEALSARWRAVAVQGSLVLQLDTAG